MTSMDGKVIVITGGASGIGLATAKLLAGRGAKVSIADLQEDGLQDAAASIKADGNTEVMTSKLDVRDSKSVQTWIKATVERFGKIDGAANLAGVFRANTSGTVAHEDSDNWDLVLGINVTGVMHCMRAQIPHMTEGGSIVNAASIMALEGAAGCAAYAASKHAVLGLSRSCAKEAGPKGIRVNCIAPGYIDTPMLKSAVGDDPELSKNSKIAGALTLPLGRLGKAEEVATVIAFLLSGEASFITGACLSVDGGWNC